MFDRKKQLSWAKLKVGIVISLAFSIVFFVIIFSGGIKSLFQRQETVKILIPDVKGLRAGAPVRVAGVEVGNVEEIKLDEKYGTIVTVSINKDVFNFLRKDAKASVQTIGLLGDKYVEIWPGKSQDLFDKSQFMEGYSQIEIKEIIGVASNALVQMDRLIEKINTLISDIQESKGTVYSFIKDPTLYNNLTSLVSELKITTNEIRSGSLGMISRDKEIYHKLNNILSNLEKISNKINTSEGSLSRLINEPELYENLLSLSQKIDRLLGQIENSEGTLALLLRDKQTASDLKQTIQELRSLLEEIKKDPKKFFKFSIF